MAQILTKRTSVYLKQQQTLPVAPDGFLLVNTPPLVVPVFSTVETNKLDGNMNSKSFVVDTCRSSASFTIATNIRETGTPFVNAPDYAELMKICGFEAKATPVTDTYQLVNDLNFINRGSALIYLDDKKFKFTNTLVGALTATFQIGTLATLSAVVSGYIDDVKAEDETNPTPPATANPPLVVSCADLVLEGGATIQAESIVITTNPEIQNSYTMGGVQGLKADTITDYSLQASVTFPVEKAKYKDNAEAIESGTLKTMRVIIGADSSGVAVDGKSVVIEAKTSRTIGYTDNDNNGILYRTVTYKLENSTAPAIEWSTGKTSTV